MVRKLVVVYCDRPLRTVPFSIYNTLTYRSIEPTFLSDLVYLRPIWTLYLGSCLYNYGIDMHMYSFFSTLGALSQKVKGRFVDLQKKREVRWIVITCNYGTCTVVNRRTAHPLLLPESPVEA